MLIDKTTNKTYSSGTSARRELGVQTFNKKVKNNDLVYVQISE